MIFILTRDPNPNANPTLTLTLTQSVVADRFSLAHTVMPPVVQYPVQDTGYLLQGDPACSTATLSRKAAALRDLTLVLV